MRSTDDRSDVDRAELIQDDTTRVGRHESGDADITPTEVPTEARIDDVRGDDARQTDIPDAEFRDADVRDAEFGEPEVQNPEVRDAEVRDAEVRDAEAREAEVDDAEVRDAADTPVAVGVAPAIPTQNRAPADDRLLDGDVSGRFQERWREVQASFVDDPTAAVAAAAALLDEVGTELTNAIRRQRDTLGAGDARGQGDETERLRTSLQAYRRLVVHLIEA